MSNPYADHNEQSKANFDGVYDLPDPRGYFEALGSLDYRAPEHGRRVFSALLGAMQGENGDPPRVLDLCCSYGVNAALLKHDLTLDDLYERYASPVLAGLSAEELSIADAAFYKGRRRTQSPEVVGTDAAASAVFYALRAGLLDGGTAENLEEGDPTEALHRGARRPARDRYRGRRLHLGAHVRARAIVRDAGPGERRTRGRRRSLGSRIRGALRGLRSHRRRARPPRPRHGKALHPHVPAATFRGCCGAGHVLRQLAAAGIDPTGKEEEGWYHADLYLSRPAEHVAAAPADDLLYASVASVP